MSSPQQAIAATRHWLRQVVIGHNFCPFARRVAATDGLHYHVCERTDPEGVLADLSILFELLDDRDTIDTALLILPQGFDDYFAYLDLVAAAELWLTALGLESVYQLASFHPEYCFANTDYDDAANFTNRSPYPMLHVLREASVAKAIATYPDIEAIPERNITKARGLGAAVLSKSLQASLVIDE